MYDWVLKTYDFLVKSPTVSDHSYEIHNSKIPDASQSCLLDRESGEIISTYSVYNEPDFFSGASVIPV